MKLGSLFDGAGTFPFAAKQYGIQAVWASEIEKFPVEVTKKRFPDLQHLGDITKIDGAKIEPVEIITFGSPCQDLSVAGKQAGLKGDRSGLFMEAVRIIKEMRRKTNGEYPRFAVWENVPGAFSSNSREDFRVVLEELCKIKDETAYVPRPTGKGKWEKAGLIMGEGYSIAWRVLDAQFWGVPQRRRRIFLVADFRGESAGQVLFEREGLSRSFAESRETWKGITESTAFCTRKSREFNGARDDGNGSLVFPIENHPADSRVKVSDDEVIQTLTGRMGTGGGNVPLIPMGVDTYNQSLTGDKAKTLLAGHTDFDGVPCVAINLTQDPVPNEKVFPCLSTGNPIFGQANLAICMATQQGGAEIAENLCPTITASAGMSGNNQPVICLEEQVLCAELGQATRTGLHIYNDLCGTLRANAGDNKPTVVYAIDRAAFNQGENAKYDIGVDSTGIAHTLTAKGSGAVCCPNIVHKRMVVRRVTPAECARLQGMPDWWCKDIPHSDSAEYKMWGNGMALPCVMYVMEGMAKALKEYEEVKI